MCRGTFSTHQGRTRPLPLVIPSFRPSQGPGPGLTGNADVGLLTLGGARGAPRHTLAPVLLQPKHLLHLLPRDVDADLHGRQPWGQEGWVARVLVVPCLIQFLQPRSVGVPAPPRLLCSEREWTLRSTLSLEGTLGELHRVLHFSLLKARSQSLALPFVILC